MKYVQKGAVSRVNKSDVRKTMKSAVEEFNTHKPLTAGSHMLLL